MHGFSPENTGVFQTYSLSRRGRLTDYLYSSTQAFPIWDCSAAKSNTPNQALPLSMSEHFETLSLLQTVYTTPFPSG